LKYDNHLGLNPQKYRSVANNEIVEDTNENIQSIVFDQNGIIRVNSHSEHK
jgi:hypothetical protein